MFTGIIESKGRITNLERFGDSLQIHLETGFSDLAVGESVAVNGVCLTVTQPTAQGECNFFLSPETLDKSNLSKLATGDTLNLERALTLQTRLSGHWVQGHVDGKAEWLSAQPESECYAARFLIPKDLARYCVEKGSICLNGVSLTINSIVDMPDLSGSIIQITIIPHTWNETNLSKFKLGDTANVEVDILAKYVERLCRN
ncbi:MAG: riboflavin synthase [Bdellovibrionia bacterium]